MKPPAPPLWPSPHPHLPLKLRRPLMSDARSPWIGTDTPARTIARAATLYTSMSARAGKRTTPSTQWPVGVSAVLSIVCQTPKWLPLDTWHSHASHPGHSIWQCLTSDPDSNALSLASSKICIMGCMSNRIGTFPDTTRDRIRHQSCHSDIWHILHKIWPQAGNICELIIY